MVRKLVFLLCWFAFAAKRQRLRNIDGHREFKEDQVAQVVPTSDWHVAGADNLRNALSLLLMVVSPRISQPPRLHDRLTDRMDTAEQKASLSLCTHKTCRKDGASDTKRLLRALASTHAGIRDMNSENSDAVAAADLQTTFAKEFVKETGCLGCCGAGPNVVNTATGEITRNVYGVSCAKELLQEIGLDIPEAASKAYLMSMYADRKLKDFKLFPKRNADCLKEALELLTKALNLAGTLRVGAAALLTFLLKQRAEAYELGGDEDAARKDHEQAKRMSKLTY